MTPATIYLRELPNTLDGMRREIETKKARLVEELAALDHDHARVSSLLAVLQQGADIIHLERVA